MKIGDTVKVVKCLQGCEDETGRPCRFINKIGKIKNREGIYRTLGGESFIMWWVTFDNDAGEFQENEIVKID